MGYKILRSTYDSCTEGPLLANAAFGRNKPRHDSTRQEWHTTTDQRRALQARGALPSCPAPRCLSLQPGTGIGGAGSAVLVACALRDSSEIKSLTGLRDRASRRPFASGSCVQVEELASDGQNIHLGYIPDLMGSWSPSESSTTTGGFGHWNALSVQPLCMRTGCIQQLGGRTQRDPVSPRAVIFCVSPPC